MEKDPEVQFKWCNGHAVYADGEGVCAERCWWKESLDGSRRWWDCSIKVQMTVDKAREFIKAIREGGSAGTPSIGTTLEFFQGDNGPTLEWCDGVILYYDESRGMAETMADDMERVLKHMGVEA
jgi:hypothetical protein